MDRPLEVGSQFGIDPNLWNRNWAELSGGEGQRIMMAIGVALGTAEVLLLDGEYTFFLFHPPLSQLSTIGSDATFLPWSGTLALITLTSNSIAPTFEKTSTLRRLLRGSRTYVRSGPRDHAGRGEVHPINAM